MAQVLVHRSVNIQFASGTVIAPIESRNEASVRGNHDTNTTPRR